MLRHSGNSSSSSRPWAPPCCRVCMNKELLAVVFSHHHSAILGSAKQCRRPGAPPRSCHVLLKHCCTYTSLNYHIIIIINTTFAFLFIVLPCSQHGDTMKVNTVQAACPTESFSHNVAFIFHITKENTVSHKTWFFTICAHVTRPPPSDVMMLACWHKVIGCDVMNGDAAVSAFVTSPSHMCSAVCVVTWLPQAYVPSNTRGVLASWPPRNKNSLREVLTVGAGNEGRVGGPGRILWGFVGYIGSLAGRVSII